MRSSSLSSLVFLATVCLLSGCIHFPADSSLRLSSKGPIQEGNAEEVATGIEWKRWGRNGNKIIVYGQGVTPRALKTYWAFQDSKLWTPYTRRLVVEYDLETGVAQYTFEISRFGAFQYAGARGSLILRGTGPARWSERWDSGCLEFENVVCKAVDDPDRRVFLSGVIRSKHDDVKSRSAVRQMLKDVEQNIQTTTGAPAVPGPGS